MCKTNDLVVICTYVGIASEEKARKNLPSDKLWIAPDFFGRCRTQRRPTSYSMKIMFRGNCP
jgi:hypothetical protein